MFDHALMFCFLAVAVTCPNLENPGNGTVDVSGNQPGDTAVYSCDDGFTLDGVDTRTCGENGQWSGSEPTCVGKYALPHLYKEGLILLGEQMSKTVYAVARIQFAYAYISVYI